MYPYAVNAMSFLLVNTCCAGRKTKAADLVTDGQAINTESERYNVLFDELQEQHKFNRNELNKVFTGVSINRRVLELMDTQWEAKPYYKYRPLFITSKTISTGKKKLKEYRDLLDRIETKFGVDREVIIAIWGIESRFGTHSGSFPVFETLNTLFDAYPRRSNFSENSSFIFCCCAGKTK